MRLSASCRDFVRRVLLSQNDEDMQSMRHVLQSSSRRAISVRPSHGHTSQTSSFGRVRVASTVSDSWGIPESRPLASSKYLRGIVLGWSTGTYPSGTTSPFRTFHPYRAIGIWQICVSTLYAPARLLPRRWPALYINYSPLSDASLKCVELESDRG